jgi:hypothetical protein
MALVIQAAAALATLAVVVASARWATPEASYVVAAIASQLLSPVLWDHYAVLLLLPVAYLCAAGRWWALALPLFTATPVVLGAPAAVYPLSFALALLATSAVGVRSRARPAPG